MHDNLYPNNVHLWNGKVTGRIDLVSVLPVSGVVCYGVVLCCGVLERGG
jgi:hypothetical protein